MLWSCREASQREKKKNNASCMHDAYVVHGRNEDRSKMKKKQGGL